MTDVELQLRELSGSVAYPPTPDLARAVRLRLAERRPWWRVLTRRQALAAGLAVVAASAAAALAVPSARTAILRFLRIGSATVERVETLPPAEERPLTSGLGRPVAPEIAARLGGFRMLVPDDLERPDRIYVRDGLQSALLDVRGTGPVLLSEVRGVHQFDFVKKVIEPATRVEETRVNGRFAIWIEGASHVVMFQGRSGRVHDLTTRLAGNVLIWTRGDLTLRLEGELTMERALELAASVREPVGR